MIHFSIELHGYDGYPVQVTCWETWLDSSTYHRQDRMQGWLAENQIEYKNEQDGKKFTWHFTCMEDAMVFALRWS